MSDYYRDSVTPVSPSTKDGVNQNGERYPAWQSADVRRGDVRTDPYAQRQQALNQSQPTLDQDGAMRAFDQMRDVVLPDARPTAAQIQPSVSAPVNDDYRFSGDSAPTRIAKRIPHMVSKGVSVAQGDAVPEQPMVSPSNLSDKNAAPQSADAAASPRRRRSERAASTNAAASANAAAVPSGTGVAVSARQTRDRLIMERTVSSSSSAPQPNAPQGVAARYDRNPQPQRPYENAAQKPAPSVQPRTVSRMPPAAENVRRPMPPDARPVDRGWQDPRQDVRSQDARGAQPVVRRDWPNANQNERVGQLPVRNSWDAQNLRQPSTGAGAVRPAPQEQGIQRPVPQYRDIQRPPQVDQDIRRPSLQKPPEPSQTPYQRRDSYENNHTPAPQFDFESPRRPSLDDSRRINPQDMREVMKTENYGNEEDSPRKRSILMPIVIVLLLIGVAMAGICLPDWDGMGGGVGSTMGKMKSTLLSGLVSLKNMIIPEEEPIKSFIAVSSENIVPVKVQFTVQTSRSVKGIRIVNDNGVTVYQQPYADTLIQSGEVIQNSNAFIWKPTCMITEAYTGGFSVYATKGSGEESKSVHSEASFYIEEPDIPPVQNFVSDKTDATAPAEIVLTLTTSQSVTAVRVVDRNDHLVTSMNAADNHISGDNFFQDEALNRIWTLYAMIDVPYSGVLSAQYQTDSDPNFTASGFSVTVNVTEPIATEEPVPDDKSAGDDSGIIQGGLPIATPSPKNVSGLGDDSALDTQDATTSTPEPTAEPTAEPTVEPTPEPTPEPEPVVTPLPTLSASSNEATAPDALKLKSTITLGIETVKEYSRANPIRMLSPFIYDNGADANYTAWPQAGITTFRGGPFRQNAASGTAEVTENKLTQLWFQPVGSMRTKSSGTLTGVGAPGQPLIVKWFTDLRPYLGLKAEQKEVSALKEVIVAGQDGKIYFNNLRTGEATRDPISIGAPSAGGLAVATNGTPILGVGQSISKLPNKTVDSGYHIIDLMKNKDILLFKCNGSDKNSNYSGVTGSALFDSRTGTMIFGSQNGVLYTAELGDLKTAFNYVASILKLSSDKQGYKSLINKQDKKTTNINCSVAAYKNYVYYGDMLGVLQCVNTDTMTPIWAVNTGDSVNATPALDMEDEQTLALYTGNVYKTQYRDGLCTIRRLDALTGAEVWSYVVPDIKKGFGCEASPVVGQNAISDLVIFTVCNDDSGSEVIALNKKSGSIVWQQHLATSTVSSPVAVYDESGEARLIQCEADGNIHMMNARSGEILSTLKLNAEIEASPAVYDKYLVVGTTGKNEDAVGIYCFTIQ